jgi:hypothetical protein
MHQHHAHLYFGVLATLAGMRRSGNTARHNTLVRKYRLTQWRRTLPIVFFLHFYFIGAFLRMEEVCRLNPIVSCRHQSTPRLHGVISQKALSSFKTYWIEYACTVNYNLKIKTYF